MEFICTDGQKRIFESLPEYLARRHGFDIGFLRKDGMLKIDSVGMSFTEQMKFTLSNGYPPPASFIHFSKKHYRRCPASVRVIDLLEEFEWISVLDAFQHRKQSDLNSKMDLLTLLARIFVKSNEPELESLIFPSDEIGKLFKTNLGIQVTQHSSTTFYVKELGSTVLALHDGEDQKPQLYATESLFGYIDYIYVIEKQKHK